MMLSLRCPPTKKHRHKHTASMLLPHLQMQCHCHHLLHSLPLHPPANIPVLQLQMLLVMVITALKLSELSGGLPLHLLKVWVTSFVSFSLLIFSRSRIIQTAVSCLTINIPKPEPENPVLSAKDNMQDV